MVEGENVNTSSDENCTTLNLQVFVCSVCGEDHETENCVVVQSLRSAVDAKIISRARQTLPKYLNVKTLADASTSVVTTVKIEQGTQFGPFQAPLSLDLPPSVLFPLKVFGKTLDEGYYLDTTDEESCNWMCLVATATTTREQNLICYDIKQSIYFATTRDIHPGEELRLWYALYYGLKLQALPLADEASQEEGFFDLNDNDEVEGNLKTNNGACVVLGEDLLQTLAQHLPAHVLGASGERDVWICKLCGLQESNVACYARHLMTHYRQPANDNRHCRCKTCLKRFLNKKMLDEHLLKTHSCESEPGGALANSLSSPEDNFSDAQHVQTFEIKHSKREEPCGQTEPLSNQQLSIDNVFADGFKLKTPMNSNGVASDLCADVSDDECRKALSSAQNAQDFKMKNEFSKQGEESNSVNAEAKSEVEEKTRPVHETVESGETICDTHLSQSPATCEQQEKSMNVGYSYVSRMSDTHHGTQDSQFCMGSSEGAVIHASNGASFTTSIDLSGAHDIDFALENGEPITFIMVENEGNESVKGNIISNANLTSQRGITDSHSTSQGKLVSGDATCQQPNEDSSNENSPIFNCDICQKSFGKCSYLYRHLRKHTGEFTCVTCLAVFARKENLKTHSCSQPKEWFPCPTCGKKFSAKKYLQRHTPMHTGEFTCADCKRHFVSRLSLKFHRCTVKNTTTDSEKASASCFMCEKVFGTESKLKSHLKVHSNGNSEQSLVNHLSSSVCKSQRLKRHIKRTEEEGKQGSDQNAESDAKVFICEVCGAIFKSSSSMKTHRFRHGEKKFECDICKKRFHRKDVLQEHHKSHQEPNYPCVLCGKKYKTKKSLYVHSLIHEGSKRFSCGVCDKQFFQKGNLVKHLQTHASGRTFTCNYCDKSFSSKEYFNIHELTHTQGKIHRCEECKKGFVKKHLLDSHNQLFHSNRGYLCKFCNSVFRYRHTVRRHLEKCHSDNCLEWSLPGFIDLLVAELPQDLLNPAGDSKSIPKHHQARQQLLESLRNKHFQNKNLISAALVNAESSSDFIYSPVSSSEPPQGDPLIVLQQQSSHQMTLINNLLPDYDQMQSSAPASHSLLVPGDVQGSESEILFTLVDQDTSNISSVKNTTPVLTSALLGNNVIGLDSGATYMMDNGNSSVLLYVVETSNGDEGDSEDLVWCRDSVGEKL